MNEQVKSVGELFAEAWSAYTQRGLTILGVLIVSSLVTVVCATALGMAATGVLGGFDQVMASARQGQIGLMHVLLISTLLVFFVLLALWGQSAVLAAALDNSLGILAAMRVGWQKLWGLSWILLLVSSIVVGGFLLFILPGIFFSVSLLFAVYFYFDTELRGMDAVLASHYAVKGRWWNVLGKLILLWLMTVVLELIPVIGHFLYFVFLPFLLFFLVALYRNLRETTVEPAVPVHRIGWHLLAALGFGVTTFGLIGVVVAMGPQLPGLFEQWQHTVGRMNPGFPQPDDSGANSRAQQQPRMGQNIQDGANGALQWNDPVGDVVDYGVGRWLDIEQVQVRTEDASMYIDLVLHSPLTAAYNAASTTAQSLHRLAVLYVDTDMKRTTGNHSGKQLARGGYDLGVDITLETPRNRPLEGNIHVSLFRLRDGIQHFVGPLPEECIHIGSKNISLQLPYTLLGVRPGNAIRMSFVESAQKQGSGLVKDKIIVL